MAKPIHVVLADDHLVVRTGLKILLEQEPSVKVVGETGDGREAVALVETMNPDVLVLSCRVTS